MTDAVDRRDALAEALAEAGWEVLDTFGDLRGGPPRLVVRVDLTIEGVRFEGAELAVAVTEHEVRPETVSVSDQGDLDDEQRAVLDDVREEKVTDPEMTLWNYDPGSADDDVDAVMDELRAVAEGL